MSEVRLRSNGRKTQEQQESSDSDGNAKKITLATEGLVPFFTKILRQKTSKENALDIAEYINTLKREINISLGYKRINIQTLVDLSKFYLNRKN
ncbi:MAG: hypothetical protein WAQ29_12325, partial [Nitrososphaeraceae archaeon]